MGVDCYGWVEVHDPSTLDHKPPRFPDWWSGIIRIDDVVERNDQVCGYFFDVHNPFDETLAGRRGMPPQVSREVQNDAGNLDSPAAASWVLWSELRGCEWQSRFDLPEGWRLLFALMERLAMQYGGERVRLVVWFDHVIRI